MSKPLNSFAAQYFPLISIDQNTIIFTGRTDYTLAAEESIYISHRIDNKWSKPTILSKNINTKNNEGACTLSADGNILIFSAYKRADNIGSCDLYICYKKKGKWSIPKNLGPNINSKGWQSQPSLSSDGKTLFFASNRRGNIGKKDIWKSELKSNGSWGKAINLGKEINTRGNEISPFIHPNNKTLFFASDRSPSLGGLDIYFSDYKKGKWSKPENLGFPINNFKDQVSLFITADGKKGYYAAGNQKGIYYSGKIYEFDIPKQLIPKPVCTYIKGQIRTESKINPLNTKIYVFNIQKNKIVMDINITENGNFCVPLQNGSDYNLYISQKGHKVEVINMKLKEIKELKGVNKTVQLNIVKKNETINFKNILFDFDEYIIKKEAKIELNGIIIFLKNNPNIKIIIEGYTDKKGSNLYNKILSEKRAKQVYNFLIDNGISFKRLSYKGLGKGELNESDERNRKVVFRITHI